MRCYVSSGDITFNGKIWAMRKYMRDVAKCIVESA